MVHINLSTLLVNKSYLNETELFWNAVATILGNGEHVWKGATNQRLSDITTTALITIYTLLMISGSFGNILVLLAISRKSELRTLQNAFVINLAISDLLLCLVTMPLTLIEIVNYRWPFGNSVITCKAAGGLQTTFVFVSTISITVIALDRYQLIVYPMRDGMKSNRAAITAILFIWLIGILLASPIYIFRTLDHHIMNLPRRSQQNHSYFYSINYCYENWPITHGRAVYSASALVLQYAVPIIIISVLHSKICKRLILRHSTLGNMSTQPSSQRRVKEAKLLRRRQHILLTIALIFSITWLPLNIFNLTVDLYNPFNLPEDEEKMLIIYAVAHLIGMSSACINPFLYGWLNENFRSEFTVILAAPFRFFRKDNAVHNHTETHVSAVQLNDESYRCQPEAIRDGVDASLDYFTPSTIDMVDDEKQESVILCDVSDEKTFEKAISDHLVQVAFDDCQVVVAKKTISIIKSAERVASVSSRIRINNLPQSCCETLL